MREFSSVMQEHLSSGATTMCYCWRLVRHDGLVMGFTDHDRALNFDATLFDPGTGFSSARAESQLGFGVGGTEVSGVLSSPLLDASSLGNGLYDDAKVETWLVNWNDTDQRALLEAATIGEIRRSDYGFTAELRSNAHALDQERGRVYQSTCDAELGDGMCRVNVQSPQFTTTAQVVSILSRSRLRLDVTGFAADWFCGGRAEILTGLNAGAIFTIESFRLEQGAAVLGLWTAPANAMVVDDQIMLTAGCNKTFATCRNKYSNLANFRGFPHIPGYDALMTHPGAGNNLMDGGSLFNRAAS